MSSSNHQQHDNVMPKVGDTIVHPKEGEFRVVHCLASGPFSDVFRVRSERCNELYAMKVEREEGTIRPVLKLDVYVLLQLGKKVGFPRLICAGRTLHYKYAVLQLVGIDLGRLRRAMPQKRFSIATALRVALQTLERIEVLHDFGWLDRDIKAPNFAIGLGHLSGTVFMLDFGFARRYRDKMGNSLAPRSAAALLGTIHYAPLASHAFQEQCRRDDLESWLYMIVEFTGGPLPWSHMDAMKQHKMIGEWKQFCRGAGRAHLFGRCPAEYEDIMEVIDSVSFYERPDYTRIANLLESAMDRFGVDREAPLDWQARNGILLRAEFVGDLGESHLASFKLRARQDEREGLVSPPMDAAAFDEQEPQLVSPPAEADEIMNTMSRVEYDEDAKILLTAHSSASREQLKTPPIN